MKNHCIAIVLGLLFIVRLFFIDWTLANVKMLLTGVVGGMILSYAIMCWVLRR